MLVKLECGDGILPLDYPNQTINFVKNVIE